MLSALALFVALGGGAYAASLPGNSVGTAQLKANPVTGAKIKNGTPRRADFAAGEIPSVQGGVRGEPGPAGAQGPPGRGAPRARTAVTARRVYRVRTCCLACSATACTATRGSPARPPS